MALPFFSQVLVYVALVRRKWFEHRCPATGELLSWWRKQEGPPASDLDLPMEETANGERVPRQLVLDYAHLQSPAIVLFSGNPSVHSVCPSHIPTRGGELVTITGTNLSDGQGRVSVIINDRSQRIVHATPTEVRFRTTDQSKTGVVGCSIESNTGSYNLQGCILEVGRPVIHAAYLETDQLVGALRPGDTWLVLGDNFGNDATLLQATLLFAGDITFKCQSVRLVDSHSTFSFVVPRGYGDQVVLKLTNNASHSCVLEDPLSFVPLQIHSLRSPLSDSILLVGGPFPCDAVVTLGDTTALEGVVGNNGRELRVHLPVDGIGTDLAIMVMMPGQYRVVVPANLTFSFAERQQLPGDLNFHVLLLRVIVHLEQKKR